MASKRSISPTSVVTKVPVVLLDIEGTTTSISFVKEELFPYILKNIASYLDEHWAEAETKADIESLRQQAQEDTDSQILEDVVPILPEKDHSKEDIISSAVENVRWLMSVDRKSTSLKQLQGHMWADAYKSQQVKGHLYEDVTPCLKRWKNEGKTICIYSSGSVAAQKLLFKYSVDGDITQNLTDYFDTKIGGKREAKSYSSICSHLEVQPNDVTFLTDIYEEAQAAREAGLQVVIVRRPGNAKMTPEQLEDYTVINTFQQLLDNEDGETEDGETEVKRSRVESKSLTEAA